MLTGMQIHNFKAWKDTKVVPLAPLTVIFGTNSSGKSSLGHLLLALKQTVQLADRKRALHLGDENSLIDLGTFADCVHGHDLGQQIMLVAMNSSDDSRILRTLSSAALSGKERCYDPPYSSLFVPSYSGVRQRESPTL